jgi:glycosyltransferase involved in cell wall biosynthesis
VAHRVICVNHPQQALLVERGIPDSKTFISMNVPDPRIFTPGAAGRRVDGKDGTFNLVYHGTMAERLGVDLIIRAVAALRQRISGLRLHLWGDGDDLSSFRALASELLVDDVVVFNRKGFPPEELAGHLSSMDVGVVGNRRGSAGDLMLPVKLMEYVSLGIPAVVPRLKAINYYFSDDMVSYFEPEDVGSMADAIYQLHQQPERYRRQAEQAHGFLRQYGWERQGDELVKFYQNLLEN